MSNIQEPFLPPPPSNLIDFSKLNINNDTSHHGGIQMNSPQLNKTTTTTTTTASPNNVNMRQQPQPQPQQPQQEQQYTQYQTNNYQQQQYQQPSHTQAEIPYQQGEFNNQQYQQGNPEVSGMDSFLSKGKVYSEQAKTKIVEFNEHYKISETVQKKGKEAKPKIKGGFNFLKTKINDLVEGKGTNRTPGPDMNPSFVVTPEPTHLQQPQQNTYQQQEYQQYQQSNYQQPQPIPSPNNTNNYKHQNSY